MAFAYVALFVGMFIIYNTFSIVVAQRMKDLAMLRAIGARRGQVLRSIVLESVLVGLVSAAGRSGGWRWAVVRPAGAADHRRPRDPRTARSSSSSATITTAFVVGA